jgi:hypothetical protein
MIQQLFTRRACIAIVTAAATVTPGGARAARISKKEAGYQDHPGGKDMECATCANYIAQSSTCRVVAGEVSAHGYCGFYTPKG